MNLGVDSKISQEKNAANHDRVFGVNEFKFRRG